MKVIQLNNILFLIFLYFNIMLSSGFLTLLFRIKHKDFSNDWYNCYCDNCGIRLKFWMANLPIINYILLKGKCKYCGNEINKFHPILEIVLGVILTFWFITMYNILTMSYLSILDMLKVY